MDMIAIKAAEGRRLVLPEGGQTLDGIGIASGTNLPDEGAFVVPGVWTRKRLDEGDAVPVSKEAIDAGVERSKEREKPQEPAEGDAATASGEATDASAQPSGAREKPERPAKPSSPKTEEALP